MAFLRQCHETSWHLSSQLHVIDYSKVAKHLIFSTFFLNKYMILVQKINGNTKSYAALSSISTRFKEFHALYLRKRSRRMTFLKN